VEVGGDRADQPLLFSERSSLVAALTSGESVTMAIITEYAHRVIALTEFRLIATI